MGLHQKTREWSLLSHSFFNYRAACTPGNYLLSLTGTPCTLNYLLLGENGFFYRALSNTSLLYAAGGLLVNLNPALCFSLLFQTEKNKSIVLGKIPVLRSSMPGRP